MATNPSNEKTYLYPMRDPENPSKITLVPIDEKVYRELYPEIWRTWKHRHYHGLCSCPTKLNWKCDGICDMCPYRKQATISLDEPLPDDEGCLGDMIPSSEPTVEDIIADHSLLESLMTRLRELDPDADQIVKLRYEHPEMSEKKIAETLGRLQRTFAYQTKRYQSELKKLMEE